MNQLCSEELEKAPVLGEVVSSLAPLRFFKAEADPEEQTDHAVHSDSKVTIHRIRHQKSRS
ncbi:MAG: hypothetical protein J5819_06065, partial [Eubacterium sp.]|nr:hypothetical protein [Eubacterium sp.]